MKLSDIDKLSKQIAGINIITPEVVQLSNNLSKISKIMQPYINAIQRVQKAINPGIIDVIAKQQKIFNLYEYQFKRYSEQLNLIKNITPNLALVSKAINPYLDIFINTRKLCGLNIQDEFYKKWERINRILERERVNSLLLDDYWLVIDEDCFTEIEAASKNKKFSTNKFIIDYYSKNKFAKIGELMEYIESFNCTETGRLTILHDCYKVMKRVSVKSAANAVIPTLTAQAEGIIKTIYKTIPKKIRKSITGQFGLRDDATILITLHYLEITLVNKPNIIERLTTVIHKKAFGRGSDQDEKYTKCRNSILHGSYSYGSKENLIRAWLEIAFLVKVYFELLVCLQNEHQKDLDNMKNNVL
jgi:hypothetical protein